MKKQLQLRLLKKGLVHQLHHFCRCYLSGRACCSVCFVLALDSGKTCPPPVLPCHSHSRLVSTPGPATGKLSRVMGPNTVNTILLDCIVTAQGQMPWHLQPALALLCLKMVRAELESHILPVNQHQGDLCSKRGGLSSSCLSTRGPPRGLLLAPGGGAYYHASRFWQVLGTEAGCQVDSTAILAPSHCKNQTQKNCTIK